MDEDCILYLNTLVDLEIKRDPDAESLLGTNGFSAYSGKPYSDWLKNSKAVAKNYHWHLHTLHEYYSKNPHADDEQWRKNIEHVLRLLCKQPRR